jgi:predicted Zn-dependent protease
MILQLARQMLVNDPHANQMMSIARLCNVSLDNLLYVLRGLLQQAPDEPYVNDARVAFQYAFTRYTDAARQLNQELDATLFADLSPGLPSPRARS